MRQLYSLIAGVLVLWNLANAQQQQNVLVLIADDVGVDAIGCYAAGSAPPPTPNIDALAARGVRMTRAHGCPSCSPTRACIQTGRYGFRTGIGVHLAPDEPGLDATETLLPEVLATSQRPRALFGKWHLGEDGLLGDDDQTPNLEGWPRFEGTLGAQLSDYSHFALTTNGVAATVHAYATTDTANRALAWIGAQNQPWLAMVCFNAGHAPLHQPPALLHTYPLSTSSTSVELFKAMVQAMDTKIGHLLAGLSPTTLANTTVIFVGDNGTGEHMVEDPFTAEHAKETLYEGGTNVPLIIAGPAVAGLPRTSAALVDTVDLFTTIAALCGVDARSVVPAMVPLDGQDLRPLLLDLTTEFRPFGYTEQFGKSATADGYAMQEARFKLIRFTGGASVVEELYDLQNDPFEVNNLLSLGATPSAEALRAYTHLRVAMAQLRGESYVGRFGNGCAGAAGVPGLTALLGAPRLGQMHTVRAAPIGASIAALGLFGYSMDTIGAVPLPLNLTPYGFTGCVLLVSLDHTQAAVLGATAATWQIPIPNLGSLLGMAFYQQMAIAEPGANPGGVIFSEALANVIGP